MHDVPKNNLETKRRSRGLLRRLGFIAMRKEEATLKAGALECAAQAEPSLLAKMAAWMGQLSRLKRKEVSILNQLDAIERKHALLRKERRLPKAKLAPLKSQFVENEPEDKEGFWFWVLALAFFFHKPKPPTDTPRNG